MAFSLWLWWWKDGWGPLRINVSRPPWLCSSFCVTSRKFCRRAVPPGRKWWGEKSQGRYQRFLLCLRAGPAGSLSLSAGCNSPAEAYSDVVRGYVSLTGRRKKGKCMKRHGDWPVSRGRWWRFWLLLYSNTLWSHDRLPLNPQIHDSRRGCISLGTCSSSNSFGRPGFGPFLAPYNGLFRHRRPYMMVSRCWILLLLRSRGEARCIVF